MIQVRALCYPAPHGKIRGYSVYPPRDVRRMQKITHTWQRLIRAKGYQPYHFPSVGLLQDLALERQHFRMAPEVYHLDSDTYLSPTGEMIMYPLLLQDPRRRSYRIHQQRSVYRKESEATRYLLRQKEIRFFYELHAMFPTAAEAMREYHWLCQRVARFLNQIGLKAWSHERPAEDRFPGAQDTTAFDTVLRDGRALQVATVHYLGDRFTRALGRPDRYQLCLGFSERILGALKDHYGSALREIDNPYECVRVGVAGRKTLRALAESAQAHYDNKYTVHQRVYRHVTTGREMSRDQYRTHRQAWAHQTRQRIMAEMECMGHQRLVPIPHKYCLGLRNGVTYHVEKKV